MDSALNLKNNLFSEISKDRGMFFGILGDLEAVVGYFHLWL